jgi:hypothetical protein
MLHSILYLLLFSCLFFPSLMYDAKRIPKLPVPSPPEPAISFMHASSHPHPHPHRSESRKDFCGLNSPRMISPPDPRKSGTRVHLFPSHALQRIDASLTTIDLLHITPSTRTCLVTNLSQAYNKSSMPASLIRASMIRKEPAVDKTNVAVGVTTSF